MELNLANPSATGSTDAASEARVREIHDFAFWAETLDAWNDDDDVLTRLQLSRSQRGKKCNGGAGAAGKPPGAPSTRSRGPASETTTAPPRARRGPIIDASDAELPNGQAADAQARAPPFLMWGAKPT